MGPIGCPETSVTNYQSTLRYITRQRRSEVLFIAKLYASTNIYQTEGVQEEKREGFPHHKCLATATLLGSAKQIQ
jgi:hypothetical protein